MTTRRQHAASAGEAAHEVVRLATEAHLAIGLGWPHHAADAARALVTEACLLAAALDPWCAAQRRDVEDSQRTTRQGTAVEETQARHAARLLEAQGNDSTEETTE